MIRYALDGNDNTKFEYRLNEVSNLVGFIQQAPLVRSDAEIVCRERWIAYIKHCLLITRFEEHECHKLVIIIEKSPLSTS